MINQTVNTFYIMIQRRQGEDYPGQREVVPPKSAEPLSSGKWGISKIPQKERRQMRGQKVEDPESRAAPPLCSTLSIMQRATRLIPWLSGWYQVISGNLSD